MTAKISLSPRIRKSAFFGATERHGALAYSVYNQTYLPIGYDTPEAEYRALTEDVTLWDVAAQRIVEITGPDGFDFANLLTPRDLTECRIGQCKYVVITDEQGGILNDPVLLRLGNNRFWLSRADSDILMWAKGVAVNAGLDVVVREPEVATLQLQGPKSAEVLRALFGDRAPKLAYYHFAEVSLQGMPLVLARTGWSAEQGYEFYLKEPASGEALWDLIMEQGAPFGIVPAAPSRIRRIEAGILDYGVDMDATVNPFEVGLDRLVQLDQAADFIGKAALGRIRNEGIGRQLVGIEIEGPPVAYNEEAWPVQRDAAETAAVVGEVTSCVHSPRLKRNIGYAMVPLDLTEPGTSLTVLSPAGPRRAEVAEKPFVDPEKRLARG